eukprot:ANDGO_03835.mRNA.1 hypothetical protein DICPUDRAFT_160097
MKSSSKWVDTEFLPKAFFVLFFTIGVILLSVALVGKSDGDAKSDSSAAVSYNIHVKVSGRAAQIAISLNNVSRMLDPTVGINLSSVEEPHVTLYLTDFLGGSAPELSRRIRQIASSLPVGYACTFETTPSCVNGSAYTLWTVTNPPCLQYLSDLIVNRTVDLVVPDQPVPPWVWSLPHDVAVKKADYVRRYGSPNVFDQFNPHITVSADSINPLRMGDAVLSSAFQSLVQQVPISVQTFGIGTVGPFGTVLRGLDIADFTVPTS